MNAAATSIFAALLNTLWQTAALAGAAWLAMAFGRRMNAATRYLVWWAVLAAMLALPLLPLLPLLSWTTTPPPHAAAAIQAEAVVQAPAPVASRPAPGPIRSATPLAFDPGNWPARLLLIWAAIFVLQLARVAWSYCYLRGVKRRATPARPALRRDFDAWLMSCRVRRDARLLVSAEVSSPVALGFRRPAVIVPAPLLAEFKGPELDHVLLHELAHIARRDDWTNLAARLLGAVVGVHPAAAWVLHQVERERELACDDWVVSMTGEARPYAASLARLFEFRLAKRRLLLASGMAERASFLGGRIETLLHRGREFTSRASARWLLLSGATLLLLVVAAAQAPRWIAFAQEPPPPPASPSAPAAVPEPPAPPAPSPSAVPPPGPAPSAPEPDQQPAPPTPPPAPPPARNKGSFLAALVAAGYGNLTVDQIVDLRNAGVSAEFLAGISQAGWGKLAPEELIRLCQYGVNPQYIAKMRAAGLKDVTLKNVIELANSGVRPEQVQAIHSLGFGPYTARQIIEFANQGMQLDLFRALKDSGMTNLDPREIVEAQNAGLSARDLREARQYGSSLTLKQIIKLKQAGVL